MITQKKTANAVGGKTARACESCLKKRASWFCPADNAFLCHACDSFVHSANELAGRHKRVRLETSSCKPSLEMPSWHQGFTKKARTPRNPKAKLSYNNTYMIPVVPEVCNDDNESYLVEEKEENDTIFSVPIFDFNSDIYNNSNSNNYKNDHGVVKNGLEVEDEIDEKFNDSLIGFNGDEWDNIQSFPPSKIELVEFAADVESLLEQDEAVKMKEDDLYKGGKNLHVCIPELKIEEEGESTNDHCYFDWSIDVESEILNFDLNNNCVNNDECELISVHVGEEEEEKKLMILKEEDDQCDNMQVRKRRKILLRLNYEDVINSWAALGCLSPWTTGRRPEFDLDHDGWPNSMEVISSTGIDFYGNTDKWLGDKEREARLSRYREKRRTRLFSKKIRYQVRKLNAEKRPRLKGRFVKRTSLSPLSPYMLNK